MVWILSGKSSRLVKISKFTLNLCFNKSESKMKVKLKPKSKTILSTLAEWHKTKD